MGKCHTNMVLTSKNQELIYCGSWSECKAFEMSPKMTDFQTSSKLARKLANCHPCRKHFNRNEEKGRTMRLSRCRKWLTVGDATAALDLGEATEAVLQGLTHHCLTARGQKWNRARAHVWRVYKNKCLITLLINLSRPFLCNNIALTVW